MKIPAKSIVISAFLTLALGLFMQATAQNARAQSAVSVSGTTWVGTDSDNDYYEYTFQADGALYYKSPSGFWMNGTWKQDGDSIYMETNNKYSEYKGRITGTHIEGNAWNIKDRKWTWVANLLNATTPSAASTVASLAGSSWTVVETDTEGSRDIFNFLADGTLSYSYQNGSYTNGTWKQYGDAIYVQMNNKYVEYKGQITGTHIEGTASNVKGNHWTWTADLKSSATVPTP